MGEEAVVGEVVGEETTTQRRGFWAKSEKLEPHRDPKANFFKKQLFCGRNFTKQKLFFLNIV